MLLLRCPISMCDLSCWQLQNPFISEFGDVQLDGRFVQIVCSDVDLLLMTPPSADLASPSAPP